MDVHDHDHDHIAKITILIIRGSEKNSANKIKLRDERKTENSRSFQLILFPSKSNENSVHSFTTTTCYLPSLPMQSNHSLRSGHKLRQFCLTMDLNITSFSSICTWILELHRVAFKINTLQIRQFTQLLTNFFETGYLII